MRKVDDGEEKKRKEEEKNGVFSGHYVIASSLPPERLRPNGYARTTTDGTPHARANYLKTDKEKWTVKSQFIGGGPQKDYQGKERLHGRPLPYPCQG